MQSFQYKVGFSTKEFNGISGKAFSESEIENLLSKNNFIYKKVLVEEALRGSIQICMNAIYKNPSSMRLDAPKAFSCSSLISYFYTEAGVWMPSLSVDKYVFGTPISKEDLKFGDLVFSNTGNGKIWFETVEWMKGTKVPEGVDHVGMYFGNNEILHASRTIGKVGIEKITESEQFKNIVGYRRMADLNEKRFVVIIPENQENLCAKEKLIEYLIKNE